MDSPSPRLPWEVIERAIDHSRGRPKTLQSLALTCSQLLPRTRLVIYARVRFKNRDHVFAFVDFLHENPHLMPVVRSIVVWPPDLAPFPLLHILPNLSEIKFKGSDGPLPPWWTAPARALVELSLHQSSLTCLQRFGTSIRTLHLSGLRFKTCMSFVRMLLAFVHLTHLICGRVVIGETDPRGGELPLSLPETIRRTLTERIKLKALTLDDSSLIADNRWQATNLGRLLLDSSNSISSMIENLTLRGSRMEMRVTGHVSFLQAELLYDEKMKTYEKLDCALLTFSQPRFICAFISPQPTNSSSFWFGELRKHLPTLSQRGMVTLQSQCKLDGFLDAGHDSDKLVQALTISPDSKWVASGSQDSTIILWDANNGTVSWRWVAHNYRQIMMLAFSPDSRYIISVGLEDTKAVIWDLSWQEPHQVATLGEDAPHVPDTLHAHSTSISTCMWSPDGRTIATGSYDGTVRLWDAQTFRQRALHKLSGTITYPLAFSPNGCWLIYTTDVGRCVVLNVTLGAPHESLNYDGYVCLPTDDPLAPLSVQPFYAWDAAFDPTGTRLAVASGDIGYIIDVETGNTLLILDRSGRKGGNLRDISFSPDGRLVLGVVNNTPHIWDAFTGTELSQLKGHRDWVEGAKFSPCGKYIASASLDRTVRLWRTSNGSCLATLSEHKRMVNHVVFSPDGKTLSSADNNGRVIIRRMRDIIPPIDTQDDPTLITPSLPPVVDPTPRPIPLPDDRAGISPDEETDPEELRPTLEREEVGEPEERRIEGAAASSGRPGPPHSTAGAFDGRAEEDEESAIRDSPIWDDQRAGSESAARSSLDDSMATTSRIAVDGDGSTSSAQLSSVTVVERDALAALVLPPTCEAQEDVDSVASPQAPTTAGQENEKRTEGNTADSGRLGLRQPIAGASIQRDEDAVESVEGNSLMAEGASLDMRASPQVEVAVEDVQMHAVRLSLPTPTGRESESPTSRGQLPTRDHAQADANSEDQVQATPAGGHEGATCSDGAMAGDGRVGPARRSCSGDSTTSSARLSSLTPTERKTPRDREQLPACEASEDVNVLAQGRAIPAVDQKESKGSAVSCITSTIRNHAADEPERRYERGVVGLRAAPDCTPVPRGGSGWRGELVTNALKTVGMNVRRTTQQIASGAKKCWGKLMTFRTKVVQRHRELHVSTSMV